MITQSYRNNSDNINLENLFSNLIDEFRRQGSILLDNKATTVLYTNRKRPFITKTSNNKIHKSKYCRKCKTTTHFTKDCFYLFPEKAPKGFNPNRKPESNKAILEQASNEALITIGKDLENMDLDPQEQVFNTQINNNNNQLSNFILDSGSTCYIVSNRSYFSTYYDAIIPINWGKAGKLNC